MCKIQTKLQHSFSEMVLKLFFHSVIFLLFYEGNLFKGKKSIYFVFSSVCPHLVLGNTHGLNKKEFSASSSVLVVIGTAHSVWITNVNIGSGRVPVFFIFYFIPLLSCIIFLLVYKYKGILGFFKLFLHAVVFS